MFYRLTLQSFPHGAHGTGKELHQGFIEMKAAALVIVEALLDADDPDMEIFLEPDFFILHHGHPKAAGRNIHQHHAFFTGDTVIAQGFTYCHILGVNFHRHFRYRNVQSRTQFDLVQHEHFIAGFPYSRGGLGRIHIHPVILHQFFKSLQDLADFLHHGKWNTFVRKGFFS